MEASSGTKINEDQAMHDLTQKELLAKKLKDSGKDSAQNSEEEDDEKETREKKEEQENQSLINYNQLGSEECPVTPDMEEVEYSMIFRIPKIENLE